ncbi:MAG: sigma 54-interacting transcriptional regulator, partial [Thermodesulfovibrionales bacterium]|nr:sigma 54-interacting transcriptional regulator [Thermodesulfovibrionales bacterium]
RCAPFLPYFIFTQESLHYQDINVIISDVFMNPNCKKGYGGPDDEKKPFGGIYLALEIKGLMKSADKKREICCLLVSDKKDAEKYFEQWIPKDWESEGFIKFVDKFPREKLKEEFLGKTYLAFVELANIGRIIKGDKCPKIIGMKDVLSTVRKLSDTPAAVTILLQGETGTGKELVARHIHENSHRKSMPFVTINCAAIAETLVESELFGICAKTATEAREKAGYFEQSHGGTIFLDEIGVMPLNQQAKLLRVLQDKKISRVGSTPKCKCIDKTHQDHTNISVDVNIIAATNKNLKDMVKSGQFREDLYYRLGTPIEIPPLRERKEDIPPLVEEFLKKYNLLHIYSLIISENTITLMSSYDWHGNVRELEELIDVGVRLGEQWIVDQINKKMSNSKNKVNLHSEAINIPDEGVVPKDELQKTKKALIMEALKRTNGNITNAAELLHDKQKNISRYCDELGLKDFIESCKKKD